MNIKELAEQAETYADEKSGAFRGEIFMRFFTEKLAELVAAAEREACAKLCDDEARQSGSDHEAGGMYWCAEKIRGRQA